MALINRDKDATEQVTVFQAMANSTPSGVSAGILSPVLATGVTFRVCNVPYPAKAIAANAAVFGLSGTPTVQLHIYRFAGGLTTIALSGALTTTAYGTSGALGFSLTGASWLLQAGDLIVALTGGSNSALTEANVSVAIQALQDYKTSWGVAP